jgi:hypothetical protein
MVGVAIWNRVAILGRGSDNVVVIMGYSGWISNKVIAIGVI